MRRSSAILVLLAAFALLPGAVLAQDAATAERYAKQAPFFATAYAANPQVPRGVLEAVSYVSTSFNDLQPAPSLGSEAPPSTAEAYGPMGLIADGGGVLSNTLDSAAALAGLPVDEVRSQPASNVLAYAKAFTATRAQLGITGTRIEDQIPVLIALSGFHEQALGRYYPLDHFIYSILRFLNAPELQAAYGFPAYSVDLTRVFGADRLRLLQARQVDLSSGAVTAGPVTAEAGGDDPGATWMPAGCDNVKTFDRGGAPTHIAVHVTERSFDRALARYLNCDLQESPHYLVSQDGTIVQLVREGRASFHLDTSSANRAAIGIAHAGFSSQGGFSGAMVGASADLVSRIAARTGINTAAMYSELGSGFEFRSFDLPDCILVKGHDHFAGQGGHDPGPFWPWADYFQAVNGFPPPKSSQQCNVATQTACSGSLTDDNGSIFGNGYYADDARQVITLQAPPGAAAIRLDFANVSMANGDWLRVYDGACTTSGLLGAWSGQHAWGPGPQPVPFAPPTSITSTGPVMTVETRTDCAIGAAGFEATWTAVKSDGSPFCCPVPTHFKITDRRSNGVTLQWNAVTGAQGYELQWRRTTDFNWS